VSTRELDMSAQLVESMSAELNADQFQDDYQRQLQQTIEDRLAHDGGRPRPTAASRATESDGTVIDLMEALRRSVDRARKPASPTPRRSAAKKPAAKKPAAKKPAATKASAKGVAASRTSARSAAASKDPRRRAG